MAYFAPYIDDAGLHIPTYQDIKDDLVTEAKKIFGEDIYLENDSMDYEYISAIALKMYDTLNSIVRIVLVKIFTCKKSSTRVHF